MNAPDSPGWFPSNSSARLCACGLALLGWLFQANAPAEVTPAKPAPDPAKKAIIEQKFERIVFPVLDFREVRVEEAFEYLQKQSAVLDVMEPAAAKKGVKFVVKIKPLPATLPEQSNDGSVPRERDRITVSLREIPLGEAVRYLASLANLRFRVEGDAVVLVPANTPELLVTKEWKFKPGHDAREMIVLIEGHTEGSSTVISADGKRMTVTDTQARIDLIDESLREFVEMPAAPAPAPKRGADVWTKEWNVVGIAEALGLGGGRSAKDALAARGFAFPPNSAAVYNPASGKLIVRSSQDCLERLDALIVQLSAARADR